MASDVVLERHEIEMVAAVGVRRRCASLDRLADRHGYNGENAWEQDIQAAAAELAVAKVINRYWDGSFDTYKRGDVGSLQVRSTKRPDGSLIVRPDDPDDAVYFLVVGEIPEFTVIGWIKGQDAKQERYERAPGGRPPAFFVPQDDLVSL